MRPLLRAALPKSLKFHYHNSDGTLQPPRRDGIQLTENVEQGQKVKSSKRQLQWNDGELTLYPKSQVSQRTDIESARSVAHAEYDEGATTGINVRKDVQVERDMI